MVTHLLKETSKSVEQITKETEVATDTVPKIKKSLKKVK